MAGQLFTSYFLTEGIRTTPEWEAQMSPEADLGVQLRQVHEGFRNYNQPNEAVTEDDLIIPVLKILGWTDLLAQQGSGHNEDIPDYLLFADRRAAPRRYLDLAEPAKNDTEWRIGARSRGACQAGSGAVLRSGLVWSGRGGAAGMDIKKGPERMGRDLAEPNTSVHSSKGRLVVTRTEPRS